jgi:hypothetical protein
VFVEVAWSLTLFYQCISTIWAAQHNYTHLCNLFVVDLFSMSWYLRLESLFMWHV